LLASHLHIPIQELQKKTTSSEYTEWMAFLRKMELEKANQFNPLHFYLAQIAAEIKKGRVKNPGNVSIKEFLLKFKEAKKSETETKEKDSKQFWLSSVGLLSNGKMRKLSKKRKR